MPRPRKNTIKMQVVLDPEVAQALRRVVSAGNLSQSNFVQDAIVKALRGYRPPMEFIAEGRGKKQRSALPGVLDPALDGPDGVPVARASGFAKDGWRMLWELSTPEQVRKQINSWRLEDAREPITDSEWAAAQKHMGGAPGARRGQPTTMQLAEEEA